jgi:hypothetical protein
MDDATAAALMQNGIEAYIHCGRCLTERPAFMSAAEFARLAVGYTPSGIQVWCVRHNMNVYHLDLVDEAGPTCVTHGIETTVPYAPDLDLACYQCGFDPASGQAPAPPE